ncbi:MAG: hypothetical protein AAF802_18755 [Planctomycetota bacterium]
MRELKSFGKFSEAAQVAVERAIELAGNSGRNHRIPISGVATQRLSDGSVQIVAEGVNGRIPMAASDRGYPTDHGETAAIRAISSVTDISWHDVVFATTLSPCAMCARALVELSRLGLHKFVIAESTSFPGRRDLLDSINASQVIGLAEPRAIELMRTFANRYPWDWAADIGEIPTNGPMPSDDEGLERAIEQHLHKRPARACCSASVFDRNGNQLSFAEDQRDDHAANPTFSAVIQAIGLAGSVINLRECVIVCGTEHSDRPVTRIEFGEASIGACEVFRPARILFTSPVERELLDVLKQTGADVRVLRHR